MPVYRVNGTDASTRQPRTLHVLADTEKDAMEASEARGLIGPLPTEIAPAEAPAGAVIHRAGTAAQRAQRKIGQSVLITNPIRTIALGVTLGLVMTIVLVFAASLAIVLMANAMGWN